MNADAWMRKTAIAFAALFLLRCVAYAAPAGAERSGDEIYVRALEALRSRPLPRYLTYVAHYRRMVNRAMSASVEHVSLRTADAQSIVVGDGAQGIVRMQDTVPDELVLEARGTVLRSSDLRFGLEKSYRVRVVGQERLGEWSVYHLVLAPPSRSDSSVTRDLWVDVASFAVRKAVATAFIRTDRGSFAVAATIDLIESGPNLFVSHVAFVGTVPRSASPPGIGLVSIAYDVHFDEIVEHASADSQWLAAGK